MFCTSHNLFSFVFSNSDFAYSGRVWARCYHWLPMNVLLASVGFGGKAVALILDCSWAYCCIGLLDLRSNMPQLFHAQAVDVDMEVMPWKLGVVVDGIFVSWKWIVLYIICRTE